RVGEMETESIKLEESLLDKEVEPKNVALENKPQREIEVCSHEKIDELSKVNESLVDKLQTEGDSLSQEE
ncbi:hypothetical protein ISN45_Aa02g005810, partial [Arabidopsis thaliana x Arabidopsis arenosa]